LGIEVGGTAPADMQVPCPYKIKDKRQKIKGWMSLNIV
jgi:hypothetical protein